MTTERTLKEIGLTNNEIEVYLYLLKEGAKQVTHLSKTLKLNRSSVYEALDKLTNKGLIDFNIASNSRIYQAQAPDKLDNFIKEKQEQLNSIMPNLQQLFSLNEEESSIATYKTLKGIKNIYQDIATSKKDHYVFGSEAQFHNRLPYYRELFVKIIKKNHVIVKIIRNIKTRVPKKEIFKEYQVRYIEEEYSSNMNTIIYGDKVAIIIWKEVPEGVIIKNKGLAKSYLNYFKFMWKNAEE